MKTNNIGKLGESLACEFLMARGYKIVARNFRVHQASEIDIIAVKDKTINFIEVKTTNNRALEEQYKSVNNYKVLKIRRGIAKFLFGNPRFYEYEYRIKVILILYSPKSHSPKVVFYDYID